MFWHRSKDAENVADADAAADPDAVADADAAADPDAVADAGAVTDPDAVARAPVDPSSDGAGSPVAEEPMPRSLEAGVRPSRSFVARLRSILGSDTDETAWEAVEETLIAADLGASLAIEVVASARRRSESTAVAAVQAELRSLLVSRPFAEWVPPRPDRAQPAVVLVVGVNGTGKTTSIAKLAARFKAAGQRVLLAAADTFRAAAIEQLQAWAARLDMPVVAHAAGADPSAVVFDALDAGVARRSDIVIVDTAGRLHTKHNLMDELAKVRRTIDKRLPGSEPAVLFVLDATTGQNGLAQAKAFDAASGLTGIVLSKLDSTSKGGIVFAIERTLGIPVLFIGVGERLQDLVPFDPDTFVEALFA